MPTTPIPPPPPTRLDQVLSHPIVTGYKPPQVTRIEGGGTTEHGTPEQLGALYGALALASCSFGDVQKTASVSYSNVNYSYAPLANLTKAVRKPLGDAGLVVLQPFTMGDGSGSIRTILAHKDGGRLESVIHFTPSDKDIKQLGGQTTYLARYALSRMLGLDGVEDADAHSETTPSGADSAPKQPAKKARARRRQAPRPEERPTEALRDEAPPPPTDADAPEVVAEVVDGPVTQTQGQRMRELFDASSMSGQQFAKMVKELTDLTPKTLTQSAADKVIAAMEKG